jgi:hypothetical protein
MLGCGPRKFNGMVVSKLLTACLACAACDQVYGLESVPPGDALEAPDARALKPFDAPVPISELNSASNDEDPTLTPDQLELIFVSSRAGTLGLDDLWSSTRPDLSSPWGAPTNIAVLNSASSELHPHITPDGKVLYFSSTRPGGMGLGDIYVSQRSTRTSPWSMPVLVFEIASTADDSGAAPDTSGLTLLLSSGRDSGTNSDLYLVTRPTTSDIWSSPAVITSLKTDVDDVDGVFANGGLALYFTRGGGAVRDLYVARRASTTDVFGAPSPIVELNTAASELDPWVSEDEQVMIFNSSRMGGMEDLYETRRLP